MQRTFSISTTNTADLDWDGTVLAGTNNGNVAKQTITVASVGATPGFAAVENYDYDSLNRIQIASETLTPTTGTPESWTQEFRYDRYGNRTFHEPTTTTLPKECNGNTEVCAAIRPVVNPSASTTNNRLNGYTFDDSGNTIRDAENRKFTYDAENKQTKVQTVDLNGNPTGTIGEYWYDGDGRRVKKRAYTNNVLTEETIFLYDASGKLIGEYSNEVAPSQDAKVAYLTNDHLGSPRINTDANGAVTARHDYHPFGEEITTAQRTTGIGYADDTVRKQFTGYERDNETGLDFAEARMLSNAAGRFTSPDPLLITDERIVDPQQINLYLYSRNNPLKYVDPTGLDIEIKGKEKDWALEKIKEGLSFANALGVNDQGKLAVKSGDGRFLDPSNEADKTILESLGKGLEGSEKDLFNAIIDTKTHATLEATTQDNTVDIGSQLNAGTNAVDRAEVEMVENAGRGKGGLTAGQIVKHETMEAVAAAKSGKTLSQDRSPHDSNPYPGLLAEPKRQIGPSDKKVELLAIPQRGVGRGRYEITKSLDGRTVNNVRTGNITKVTFKK